MRPAALQRPIIIAARVMAMRRRWKKCYSTLAHPRSQLFFKLLWGLFLGLQIQFQPQETDGFGFHTSWSMN